MGDGTSELIQTACSENAGKYYGIVWYSENREPEGFFYMAGRESDSQKIKLPSVGVENDSGRAIRSGLCKGPWRDRRLSLDYLYHTWLPKSGKHLIFRWKWKCMTPRVKSGNKKILPCCCLWPFHELNTHSCYALPL